MPTGADSLHINTKLLQVLVLKGRRFCNKCLKCGSGMASGNGHRLRSMLQKACSALDGQNKSGLQGLLERAGTEGRDMVLETGGREILVLQWQKAQCDCALWGL